MRILFDQGTPVPLRLALSNHQVSTAYEKGWADLENGSLLRVAETEFDLFITTDRNLRDQQDLAGRRLSILVLPTTSWPRLRAHVARITAAIDAIRVGECMELSIMQL